MDGERNLSDSLRPKEYKLSKKQRRVVQKQLKLRNTLARHENIICSDSATMVCVLSIVLYCMPAAGRLTTRFMDVSPLCQFAPWTFRPLDVSPSGRFAPWTFRHLDDSPPRRFATWTFRHHAMDDSPPWVAVRKKPER